MERRYQPVTVGLFCLVLFSLVASSSWSLEISTPPLAEARDYSIAQATEPQSSDSLPDVFLPLLMRSAQRLELPTAKAPTRPTEATVPPPTSSPSLTPTLVPTPTPGEDTATSTPIRATPTGIATHTRTPRPRVTWPANPPDFDQLGLFGATSNIVMLRESSPAEGADDGADLPPRRFHFGQGQRAFAFEQPLAGDWNGDGWDMVALYDRGAGELQWVSRHGPYSVVRIGVDSVSAEIAVVGDWDGDGRDGFGLYNPTTNVYRLWNEIHEAGEVPEAGDRLPDRPDLEFAFGIGWEWPLAGDWNGDGTDTIGVFDPRTGRAYLRNDNSAGDEDITLGTGLAGGADAGYLPFSGDWDGDSIDTLGIYNGQAFEVHLFDRNIVRPVARVSRFGTRAAAWMPMAGRWNPRGAREPEPGFLWPEVAPADVGLDPERIEAAMVRASRTQNLHSLLILRQGRLAAEGYWGGFDRSMANCIKSVSKSILSGLYGIAIEEGFLEGVEQRVASVLPDEFDRVGAPHLSRLSLRHLLTMSAGLEWKEPGASLGQMVQSPDWVEHVAGLPVTNEAGQRWNYSTGLTHVASALLQEATGAPTHHYARTRLFEPLGIEASRWDFDPEGYDMGGAEVWMRPRDMARFGQLYLRGGTLDGVRILTPQWVEASTRPQLSAYGPYEYSAWWWHRTFAEREVYFAWGYGGQFIFVVPELDMVVVATSAWWRGASAATNGQVFAILEDLILPAAR